MDGAFLRWFFFLWCHFILWRLYRTTLSCNKHPNTWCRTWVTQDDHQILLLSLIISGELLQLDIIWEMSYRNTGRCSIYLYSSRERRTQLHWWCVFVRLKKKAYPAVTNQTHIIFSRFVLSYSGEEVKNKTGYKWWWSHPHKKNRGSTTVGVSSRRGGQKTQVGELVDTQGRPHHVQHPSSDE